MKHSPILRNSWVTKMNEVWKPIPGYDKYEASNLGRIRSLWGVRGKGLIILKASISRGYYQLHISPGRKNIRVHRLVMLAFYGYSGLHINHKNGVKTDNRLENLEYVSARDNIIHAYRTGLKKPASAHGESCHLAKLSEADVYWMRENYVRNGRWNTTTMAERFNVSPQTVSKILKRKIWSHLPERRIEGEK